MFRRSLTPFSVMTIVHSYIVEQIEENANMNRRTMRHGVDLSRLSNRLLRLESSLGVNQMRSKNSVDQRRLPQTSLTYKPREGGVREVVQTDR